MDGLTPEADRLAAVRQAIEAARQKLLNLTAHNPLIAFRHETTRGPKPVLRAIDTTLDVLWKGLATEKPLQVLPLPALDRDGAESSSQDLFSAPDGGEKTPVSNGPRPKRAAGARRLSPTELAAHARSHGLNPDFELPATCPASSGARPVFQTCLLLEDLDRVLVKLRDAWRLAEEEKGIQTLHIAYGFLEWYESDASDEPRLSPLLLQKLSIERRKQGTRYVYYLLGTGDDLEVNASLSEHHRRDFGLAPVERKADEAPSAFLDRFEHDLVPHKRRWRVRRFATVANFPYDTMAMFADLNDEAWRSQGGLAQRPVLSALLGGGGGGQGADGGLPEEHDIDSEPSRNTCPALVLEADASQHSAIIDALDGTHMVIEGPPGTGKSQTIANLIAAALDSGKRVLFVAEKQAALQVVKDRLDNVGLGDFCLELHSHRARKRDVLDSFKKRLDRHPKRDPRALADNLRALGETKRSLNRYAALLHRPFGACGQSVHDILGTDLRLRTADPERHAALDGIELANARDLTAAAIEESREALRRFEEADKQVFEGRSGLADHPWYGVRNASLLPSEIDGVARRAEAVAGALDSIAARLEETSAWLPSSGRRFGSLAAQLDALARLPDEAEFPNAWLIDLADAATLERARRCLDLADELRTRGVGQPLATPAAALRTSVEAACVHAPVNLAVGELQFWRNERQALADKQRVQLADWRAACDVLGLSPDDDARAVRLVPAALSLLLNLDDASLAWATAAIFDPASQAAIVEAHATCAALREEQTTLRELFPSLMAARLTDAETETVSRHARMLREAGIFGFLRRPVREARAFHRERRATMGTMGRASDELSKLSYHLEMKSRFLATPALPDLFGTRFHGLSTDTGGAADAALWAARVRRELAGSDAISSRLRSVLLKGDAGRLDALHAFALSDAGQRILETIRDEVENFKPAAQLHFAESIAATVSELQTLCGLLDISPSIPIRHLPTLVADLEYLQQIGAMVSLAGCTPLATPAPSPFATISPPLEDATRTACILAGFAGLEARSSEAMKLGESSVRRTCRHLAQSLVEPFEIATEALGVLRKALELDDEKFLGGPIAASEVAAIASRLRSAAGSPESLAGWVRRLAAKKELAARGLEPIAAAWDRHGGRRGLPAWFDASLYRSLAKLAERAEPDLVRRFAGSDIEAHRERLRERDREVTAVWRQTIAARLTRRPIPQGQDGAVASARTGEMLIRYEISKQKRHIPLRKLMERAGDAALALKPCFLMSPLSVAQFLPPNGPKFDVLVIDEASQMRPAEALGAAARASQIVVVGDSQQLPPTDFFQRGDAEPDDEEEEEGLDQESILDLASAAFRRPRLLRWHYRSRDAQLIAFSNRHFYEDRLIVFPSPGQGAESNALSCVEVRGRYRSSINPEEVEATCLAAVETMTLFPDRSLGIVTLNQKQRDEILERIEQITASDTIVREYQDTWNERGERFFVKNLETVQGDERDIIFISTVYGPAQPGEPVRQRFGPINGRFGHRRLNVLFTRAKHQVRVFTSLQPEDIRVDERSSRGVRALKDYLAFARDGRLDAGSASGRECDSEFEVFVRDSLTNAGYEVDPQVGVAGYFVDLGVRDPDRRDRYLLGVECDGRQYHASRSARDRDLLRQKILEGLGWTIYRIWSTDWFANPGRELLKLKNFISQLRQAKPH